MILMRSQCQLYHTDQCATMILRADTDSRYMTLLESWPGSVGTCCSCMHPLSIQSQGVEACATSRLLYSKAIKARNAEQQHTLCSVLLNCCAAPREGIFVDLILYLLGGVTGEDGRGGIACAHLPSLSLHRTHCFISGLPHLLGQQVLCLPL